MTATRSRLAFASSVALATALAAAPASAQDYSFDAADPTVVSGFVTFTRGPATPGVETYVVQSDTAVLDFLPNDLAVGGPPIQFQNPNTSVTYINGVNNQNYVVLNRIVPRDPTRAIRLDGSIVSQLQTSPGGPVVTGGTVWFYSPGGIIVGATSTMDVGSLLLTTGDPTGGSGTITDPNSFGMVANPGSYVRVEAGAAINALASGSYIAMVAPEVRQGGNVRVDGSAAYVAAEDTQMTINGGLFDISIRQGTDANAGTPLIHNGTTGGPASTGAGDNHGIYMVTVPKNDAITMLIAPGGNLGFDVAVVPGIENGRIVLSAGRNIVAGDIEGVVDPNVPTPASITIDGGAYSSDVLAWATTDAIAASLTRTPIFQQDLTLRGGARAFLGARNGETLEIQGDAFIIADSLRDFLDTTPVGGLALDAQGGQAFVYAENGGSISILGNLTVSADAAPGANSVNFQIGTATAGTAGIYADGAGTSVQVTGTTKVTARAFGNSHLTPGSGIAGAVLRGGDVSIRTFQGGTVTLDTGATLDAGAFGGVGYLGTGGAGFGGDASVEVTATGGALTITGDLNLNVEGQGSLAGETGVTGGDGTGGQAVVLSGGATLTVTGDTRLVATGRGGGAVVAGTDGGNGLGGQTLIQTAAGGTVALQGALTMDAGARGGGNLNGGDGVAGTGTGGLAQILADGTVSVGGGAGLFADGEGGDKEFGAGGGGGDGSGGSVLVRATTGIVSITGGLTANARGLGGTAASGPGGTGGMGEGGGVQLETRTGTAASTVTGTTVLDANGLGGAASGIGSTGGTGYGGAGAGGGPINRGVTILATGGAITLDTLTFRAEGLGGGAATGGDGNGGIVQITAVDGLLDVLGTVDGSVDGLGTDGFYDGSAGIGGGNGGTGRGGTIRIETTPDTIASIGEVRFGASNLHARGQGGLGANGFGGVGGRGGDAQGGSVVLVANASSTGFTFAGLTADAGATAGTGGDGDAANGGDGGNATAGILLMGTESGLDLPPNTAAASFGAMSLLADAVAGAGGNGGVGADGGTGGFGQGGTIQLQSRGTPVSAGNITGSADGTGGNGGGGTNTGNGGDGTAGFIGVYSTNRLNRTERGSLTALDASFTAVGTAGSGTSNGTPTGGGFQLMLENGDASFRNFSFDGGFNVGPAGPGATIDISGGTLVVASATPGNGVLQINVPGDMLVDVHDGGVLRTQVIDWTAFGSLLAGTGTPGEIEASQSASIFVGTDLYLGANLRLLAGDLSLTAQRLKTEDLAIAGQLQVFGSGIALGDVIAGGDIFIENTGSINVLLPIDGQIATGSLTSSGGSVLLTNVHGGIVGGAISAGDRIDLRADQGVTAGNLTAGTLNVAGIDATIRIDTRAGPLAIGNAGALDIDLFQGAPSGPEVAGAITTGSLTGERVRVRGQGSVATGAVTVGETHAGLEPAGGDGVVIGGYGNVSVAGITASTGILLGSRDGSVTSTGALVTPGSIAIVADTNVSLTGATTGTGANDTLFVSNSSILANPLLADYADFDSATPFPFASLVTLAPVRLDGGFAATGQITTGHLRASGLTIGLAGVTASRHIELDGLTLVAFNGTTLAPLIDVTSGDIDINAGASLGSAATTRLTLSVDPVARSVVVGGLDTGSGDWLLSNVEAQRMHAQLIQILSLDPTGDILVRDLSLLGSLGGVNANLTASTLEITAGNVLRIEGALGVASGGLPDEVILTAGGRIEVVTDLGGSIAITGPGGALTGTLTLNAPVIAAADDAILTLMAADPFYAGRNAALRVGPVAPRPEGWLQADAIVLNGVDTIAIANSNTADLYGGFSAGAGGLTINGNPNAGTPLDLWIYGRVAGPPAPDGTPTWITNFETRDVLGYNPGPAGFTAESGVNNCLLTAVRCEPPGGTGGPGKIAVNLVDLIVNFLTTDPALQTTLPTIGIVSVIDEEDLDARRLITEPVTGAGNPSLWGEKEEDEQ